jgi:hypothetical protein
MVNRMVRMAAFGVSLSLSLASTGCSSSSTADDKPDWQFEQKDMEGAVFGTWTGTYVPPTNVPAALTLDIRSHDEPVRQLSCGNRTFAEGSTPGLGLRCIDLSSLQVSASLTLDEASRPQDLDGAFQVVGTTFDNGELHLDNATLNLRLFARWDAGAWSYCDVGVGEFTSLPCTLDERAE